MTNRTYTDLLAQITALGGVDSYSANDQTRILALANRRLRMAYDASRVWPRYLVVGESRYMDENQVIPYTQGSAVVVADAGTEDVNGTYQPVGTRNGRTQYFKNGDEEGISIWWGGSAWQMQDITTEVFYYTGPSTTNPWGGTWVEETGELPVPTVTESPRAEVSDFIRIHRTQPFLNNSSQDYGFYVASDGAHVMSPVQTGAGAVFVTYKKAWDGPFASNSTSIPGEFFNYVAHAVYADIVRSGGQAEKALAEESLANEMLALELQRAEQLANNSPVGTRISTHASRQNRYY